MKKLLLLAALMGSTTLAGAPTFAQDASPQPAASTAEMKNEIEALKQQLQQMQARLQQLETTPAPAPATAPAPAPAPAPKLASASADSWTANTKIGGKAYINLSNLHQEVNGTKQGTSGTQAELKRFYVTLDHRFNRVLSANLTTDVRYGSHGLSHDDVVYVKKAYLQADISPALRVRVGSADMPWIPFVEGIYNYRFVENTLIDRTKYGTSADWGVHVSGKLAHGLINYAASAVGGQGYKTISRNTDTIDLEGRVAIMPVQGVTLAVGGYTGKLGKSSAGQPNTPHTATRWDALAAYTHGPVRMGVEYFSATNWNTVTSTTADKSTGWSAFGSYAFDKDFALFGRYDRVDPNKYTQPSASDKYFNVGLNYTGVKNVDIALVYKRDAADNVAISTSNGVIGCSTSATKTGGCTGNGTYDEFGIWTQFKF